MSLKVPLRILSALSQPLSTPSRSSQPTLMEQERNGFFGTIPQCWEVSAHSHSHFNLQENHWPRKWFLGNEVCQFGGQVMQVQSNCSLSSPVCSNGIFFCSNYVLEVLFWNLTCTKIAHIYEWLSKTVFFRERGPLLLIIFIMPPGYVQLSFSHIYVKSSVTKQLQAPSSN